MNPFITLALLAAMAQQPPQPNCPDGRCFNQVPAAPTHPFPTPAPATVFPTYPAPPVVASTPAPAPATAPAKGWHEGVFNGERRRVYGWIDGNGWLNYWESENPQLKPAAPAPKAEAPPKAREPEKAVEKPPAKVPEGPVATAMPGVLLESNGQLDAGLDVASLAPRSNQLDTNDAAFAESFYAEPPAEGEKPKPDPGPTPAPPPRTYGLSLGGAAALVMLATAALLKSLGS